ncbi:glutathione S-transferase N-terminal domain-containing protein [Rhizobium tubonense]|uniref:Glutathione S-transferase n=1 Tax=Rhizobium tubonense TaxID=484088 RepID=A0A2W4CBA4_9HYPH|nr:glutathione S-transferase N-terminal domain-containing protein [Rhizobium tubonense]PZM08608.1 glutathione S-transferase [Rhizobium tubonense]
MSSAIDLYYWPTPNGRKITIMLEELGTPYEVKYINIKKGEQFNPAFLSIAPNGKIPAIVDHDGPGAEPISIFESGAILQYLGRKFQRFYASNERQRATVDQWLFWQMANLGPMAGQANHFRNYSEQRIDYAIQRYTDEVRRLYRVMDQRLAREQFLAVDYSIADMASFGWIGQHANAGLQLDEFSNVRRWFEAIDARPAVRRAIEVGREERKRQRRLAREERRITVPLATR